MAEIIKCTFVDDVIHLPASYQIGRQAARLGTFGITDNIHFMPLADIHVDPHNLLTQRSYGGGIVDGNATLSCARMTGSKQ